MTSRTVASPVIVADYLKEASGRVRSPAKSWKGELYCGIDLGTSTVVLSVIDSARTPIFVDAIPCQALRDGVVVDFFGAARAVTHLVEAAEASIGHRVTSASTGFPPGIGANESRACRSVLEHAGLSCAALIDEVSAANALLSIDNGVLVDVGAGSTGVGIFLEGGLVAVGDVPGGGYHLNLILAGALGTSTENAERLKRENSADYAAILRPGLERIAVSIEQLSSDYGTLPVHLAGGGLMVAGASVVIAQYLERRVVEYPSALYITPLGLAWSCL